VGCNTLVADAYGIKTDREFVNTLEDNIRERGAIDKLISDSAKAEMSDRVKDILHALVISDWQSEPYIRITTLLRTAMPSSRRPLTGFLTGLVLQLPYGYLPLPMFVSFSTIWLAMLLAGYLQTRH
jgi:hypothetical protein